MIVQCVCLPARYDECVRYVVAAGGCECGFAGWFGCVVDVVRSVVARRMRLRGMLGEFDCDKFGSWIYGWLT